VKEDNHNVISTEAKYRDSYGKQKDGDEPPEGHNEHNHADH
jgi:hypothetical protein